MDRREFLKLFSYGSLLALAPAGASQLGAFGGRVDDDVEFHSALFGFTLKAPASWTRHTAESYVEAIRTVIVPQGVVFDAATARVPIVAISEKPEPSPEFNPVFGVFGDRRREWMGADLALFHRERTEHAMSRARDPKVLAATTLTTLGGIAAATSSFRSPLFSSAGPPELVVTECTTVFHREFVLSIETGDREADNRSMSAVLGRIRKSLAFS